jgi:hypothetical protein
VGAMSAGNGRDGIGYCSHGFISPWVVYGLQVASCRFKVQLETLNLQP